MQKNSVRKGKEKVTKDPDLGKFTISTLLLLKEVVFEGVLLACILVLKLEDRYLIDHDKFPHLATNKYMTKIYYEETSGSACACLSNFCFFISPVVVSFCHFDSLKGVLYLSPLPPSGSNCSCSSI